MEWQIGFEVAEILGVIALVAAVVAIFLTPFAMGFSFVALGLPPFYLINTILSLLKRRQRILMLWVPYLAWVNSITALTLLSVAANWRTTFIYGGSIEGAIGITIVEMIPTTIGVSAAVYSLKKTPRKYRFVLEASNPSDSNMPFRPFAYWAAWFAGLFVLNWVIDMFYVMQVGVSIQGIGPGWIDMVEKWF